VSIRNKGTRAARPTISVCVPTFNNSATIARCLRSIVGQNGVDFEIIVIDDDSSDDCAAIARQMLRPGDRLVRNTPRLGLNGNHNKCLQLARGKCVQFVHGDDWLLPDALQTLARYFDDPAVGLAFAPREVESDDPTWTKWNGSLHTGFRHLVAYNNGSDLVSQVASRGVHRNWIGEPSCVMFRRQLALDAGQCRSDVHQLVDLDLWLRLMLRSNVCFHPRELSVHSYTAHTATAHIVGARKDWLDRLRILMWLTMDPASPRTVRSRARIWWTIIWLQRVLECAVFGPSRWTRVKYLSSARIHESEGARRFLLSEVRATEMVAPIPRESMKDHHVGRPDFDQLARGGSRLSS
jgi:glycosyltransferase involved in cell wall biosynthesis